MAWFSDKKDEREIRRLIGMLRESDTAKRNDAARQLLALGANAASGLVAALGSNDPALGKFVPQILVRMGAVAIPALTEGIRSGDPSIQVQAAVLLGEINDRSVLPILLKILASKNYKVQVAAAQVLGKIGDASVMPHLLKTLNDEDPDVRIAVVQAIGAFNDPETYLNIADLLDDPEINVRKAAAQVLAATNDPSVAPYLVEALYDSFWWYGREEAITLLLDAIRKFGAHAYQPLVKAMHAKEPTVRRFAISLLAPLKDPRSLDAMEMAFYDPNYDVAGMAAKALVAYGERTMSIFAEALNSPNEWINLTAIQSIAEIGGEQAFDLLLPELVDQNERVRAAAITALGALKDQRALPALNELAANREEREISKLARQAIATIEAG